MLDEADLEGVPALRQAAEALLAARAAGVEVDRYGVLHGDPELVRAWEPALLPHAKGISALWAARGPQR